MHAASVNPEPGSNSRLKSFILAFTCYLTVLLGIVEIWLYVCPRHTHFLYFVLLKFFVLSLRCSIFKDHTEAHSLRLFAALVERLDSISQNSRFVNRFFKNNFGFFALCYFCTVDTPILCLLNIQFQQWEFTPNSLPHIKSPKIKIFTVNRLEIFSRLSPPLTV